VPAGLQERVAREWRQLRFVETEGRQLKARPAATRLDPETSAGRAITQLQTLRAMGPTGAWVLTTALFGWRQIRNRRALAALVGLVPALDQSGDIRHDPGITRAGNPHVRRVMVPLAWAWVRSQPQSALAQWYPQRFGHGGRRLRKAGIVALARKLLIRAVAVCGDRGPARRGSAETDRELRRPASPAATDRAGASARHADGYRPTPAPTIEGALATRLRADSLGCSGPHTDTDRICAGATWRLHIEAASSRLDRVTRIAITSPSFVGATLPRTASQPRRPVAWMEVCLHEKNDPSD
jgi:hypothetical protein